MRNDMKVRQTWAACMAMAIGLVLAGPAAAVEDLDDADITTAVEAEMLVNQSVPSHRVDVSTEDGVVTLNGSVYNILARDRAAAIARSIKGVRAVVNRIDVSPTTREDVQIRNDLVTALAVDPATDSYELDVDLRDGTVTLTGTVDSYKEKMLAEQVAKGVRGVQGIENNIDVDYKTQRPDAEIKAEIERLLKADVRVDAWGIDVQVEQGAVTLAGTVGSAEEKAQARSSSWVAGVKEVKSEELDVEWWARDEMQRKTAYVGRSDEQIEAAVRDAMAQDPRVWAFNVDVASANGIVELTGVVDNLKAKQAAAQDARNTVGVWSVRNYLRVRPEPYVDDAEIVNRVESALMRDPYVDRYELSVSSYNGKVYLYGTVDNEFEKDQAADAAQRVNGVVDVQNNLVVSATWPWKSDWAIEQDIQDQLFWSPYVDGDQVRVTVDGGVATLTGTVNSWREYRAAAENARDGGAREVINRLRIM